MAPLGIVLAGVAALVIDVPVSCWAVTRHYPGLVRELLQIMEIFGHGLGVLVLVVILLVLDRQHRWAVPRLLSAAWGAGLAAGGLKLLAGRTRPMFCNLLINDAGATFVSWLPLYGDGHTHQSFPSAHTATAVAFALMLSRLYPHGRWLFCTAALLVGVQRIQCGAHFLSDVVWGAAAGWLFLVLSFQVRPAARWFDRLEDRWQSARRSVPHSGGKSHDESHRPRRLAA